MTVALPYVCVCVDSRREELEKRYTHTQEKKHTNYGQTTYPFRKKKKARMNFVRLVLVEVLVKIVPSFLLLNAGW